MTTVKMNGVIFADDLTEMLIGHSQIQFDGIFESLPSLHSDVQNLIARGVDWPVERPYVDVAELVALQDQCQASGHLPENEAYSKFLAGLKEMAARTSEDCKAKIKNDLLEHLGRELSKSKSWVERNEREGFPEAANSHRHDVIRWTRFISLVEG